MNHSFYMVEEDEKNREALVVIPHKNISLFLAGYIRQSDSGYRNMVTICMNGGQVVTLETFDRTEEDVQNEIHVDTADHIIKFLDKGETQSGGFIVKNMKVS